LHAYKFEFSQNAYLNIQCTLEGTLIGQNLYRKGGFAVEQDIIIDAGEEYADRSKDHVLFMVRPRGGPTSTNIGTSGVATKWHSEYMSDPS
jgi:hypothetical protein